MSDDPPRLIPLPPLPPKPTPINADGWADLIQPSSISHIPLADVADVLATAGIEIRIQFREKR
jgi:hypothetical protein